MRGKSKFFDPKSGLETIRTAANLAFETQGSSDFDLNADGPNSIAKYRPAAVMIPIIQRGQALHVILTKRAAHLKHHPGQVAFPGGKQDATDIDSQAAALREAWEEIGLDQSCVDMLGRLPPHKTVTGFEVQPFIGFVKDDFSPRSDPNEVEEVFEVPLEHVLEPQNYLIEGRIWMGHHRSYYVVPYGPHYIWGATARMLRMFADRVESLDENHR